MEPKENLNKGITLVALVITIIILLILAGVAITALTQTGLFENAKQAKNTMENAQNLENATLENYNNKIDEVIGSRDTITINKEEYENLKKDVAELKTKPNKKVLWSGSNSKPETLTLNDDIENYDLIMFYRKYTTSTVRYPLDVYLPEEIINSNNENQIQGFLYSDNVYAFYFVNPRSIVVRNTNCTILEIIGYKF